MQKLYNTTASFPCREALFGLAIPSNTHTLSFATPALLTHMSSEDAYTTDDQFDEKEQRHHGGGRLATATAINRNNKSTMKPRRWRPHEDHLLTAAVHQSGGTNWKAIASKVGSRNHVQCLQRWRKVRIVRTDSAGEVGAVLGVSTISVYRNIHTCRLQASFFAAFSSCLFQRSCLTPPRTCTC